MTSDDPPIEFEWTAVDDVTQRREEMPTPADPGGRRRRRVVQAASAAVVLVVLATVVLVSLMNREPTDTPISTAGGRLPASVRQIWERPVVRGVDPESARIVGDTLLFVVSDLPRPFQAIVAVDVTDGSDVWERRSSAETRISVVSATEQSLVVVTRDGGEERLVAYDVATGALRWEELREHGGPILVVPGTAVLVDTSGVWPGEDGSVVIRDPDSGDVEVELAGTLSGLDLAGDLRILTPSGDLLVFDVAAFGVVREQPGTDAAVEAVVPEMLGPVVRGVPFVVDDRPFGWDDAGIFDAQGAAVPIRSRDRQPVEFSTVDGVLTWGADRAVIQTSDSGTTSTGVVLRGGVMQVEWEMAGTLVDLFVSDDGLRAVVESSGSSDRLVDLVTGEVLAEFDAVSGTSRFAANGVLVNAFTGVDGSTMPTGVDARGERLWAVPSTGSMLGIAIGDGVVVTLETAPDTDGATLLAAYSR